MTLDQAITCALEEPLSSRPGVEPLPGDSHERHHVGWEPPVEICRDVFSLTISEGGIDNAPWRGLLPGARVLPDSPGHGGSP